MATLYFAGNQVVLFYGINDNGNEVVGEFDEATFLASDSIEMRGKDIEATGHFAPDEPLFMRVSVIRDGILYSFDVDSGSEIKESGGGIKEQGDTSFITSATVGPPANGQFNGRCCQGKPHA